MEKAAAAKVEAGWGAVGRGEGSRGAAKESADSEEAMVAAARAVAMVVVNEAAWRAAG